METHLLVCLHIRRSPKQTRQSAGLGQTRGNVAPWRRWRSAGSLWDHDDAIKDTSVVQWKPARVMFAAAPTSNIAQRHDVRRFWLISLNHVNVFSNYVKINKTDVKQYIFATGFFIISAQSQETCWKDTATIKPKAETCIVHYVLILISWFKKRGTLQPAKRTNIIQLQPYFVQHDQKLSGFFKNCCGLTSSVKLQRGISTLWGIN